MKVTCGAIAASGSLEICSGCSVVNQRAGPEANPLLWRPEQSLDPASAPGCQPGGVAEVGGENCWLRGEEPCVGRAPDSLSEWAAARDVLKLNVNPQPGYPTNFCFLWQLTAAAPSGSQE